LTVTESTATGRALCVGVRAEADACRLATLAREHGFNEPVLMLGEDATCDAVRAKLGEMATFSEPGDLFLLTFSGHGGRTSVRLPTGDLREVGAWHLHDGTLNEEQLHADLARFKPGARVLVVSDNCGGGMPSLRAGEIPSCLSASVLVLAACEDGRYADGEGLPGHFAAALRRTLSDGGFRGPYPAFHRALCRRMPDYQQPDYYRVGAADAAFESQRPFTI
jgi:hypothetical protein